MATDSMGERLAALGPETRALVELSIVRGISDDELAGMLGLSTGRIRERRVEALAALGARSEEEQAALGAHLRGEATQPELAPPEPDPEVETPEPEPPPEPPGPEPEPEPEPGPEPLAESEREPEGARRRATRLALLGGLLITVIVAGALALGDGEPAPAPETKLAGPDTDAGPGPGPDPGPTPRAPSEQVEPAPLVAVGPNRAGGTAARGSAEIVGRSGARRLGLIVRGLPPVSRGGYVVWLYNSIAEAQPLTGARQGTFALQEPLPRGVLRRYRFVDVSREPADGNPNHSGESVLRIPINQIPSR